eukprot:528526_1
MGDAAQDPTTPQHGTKAKYMGLDQGGRVMAEYVWIGGAGDDLRCKSKTLEEPVGSPTELPDWNFDGPSTGQAPGEDSEVIIKPRALFADPFRGGDNVLVLCDCHTPQGDPIPSNTRHHAAQIFSNPKVMEQKPWYGMEQEYTLFKSDGRTPPGLALLWVPSPAGDVLLWHWDPVFVRAQCCGGTLQGVPVCRSEGLRHQRRGHARAVGVPGGPLGGHFGRGPSHDLPLPDAPGL